MSLPLSLQLRPVSTSHYYISGDVTIQAGVAIAPGVLIQADPNSRIVIKTGACIGIGSILHAYSGTLEVGEGANIGAEVLLVGAVKIGANACIGAATTIYNGSVEWGQMIPPGSLIGDPSRRPEELTVTDTVIYPPAQETSVEVQESSPPAAPLATPENSPANLETQASGVNVYGQVYVNQLLVKLFPNRQPTPPPTADPLPSTDDPWAD
jgi:carbon dioxide concentrating mechanism protein CcmN